MEPDDHDTAERVDVVGDVVNDPPTTMRSVRIIPEDLLPDGVADRISPEELEQRRLRALGK